jgi:hypothetical protein
MPRFERGVLGSSPGRGTVNDGVCGVAVSARLAVNQKVAVRLRSDTL